MTDLDLSIFDDIDLLDQQVIECIAEPDRQRMMRGAIELHYKLTRVAKELQHTPPSDFKDDAVAALDAVNEALLIGVFDLAPGHSNVRAVAYKEGT